MIYVKIEKIDFFFYFFLLIYKTINGIYYLFFNLKKQSLKHKPIIEIFIIFFIYMK